MGKCLRPSALNNLNILGKDADWKKLTHLKNIPHTHESLTKIQYFEDIFSKPSKLSTISDKFRILLVFSYKVSCLNNFGLLRKLSVTSIQLSKLLGYYNQGKLDREFHPTKMWNDNMSVIFFSSWVNYKKIYLHGAHYKVKDSWMVLDPHCRSSLDQSV